MQFLRPTGHISLPVMYRLEMTPAFDIKGEGSDSVPINKKSTDNSRLLLKKKKQMVHRESVESPFLDGIFAFFLL